MFAAVTRMHFETYDRQLYSIGVHAAGIKVLAARNSEDTPKEKAFEQYSSPEVEQPSGFCKHLGNSLSKPRRRNHLLVSRVAIGPIELGDRRMGSYVPRTTWPTY